MTRLIAAWQRFWFAPGSPIDLAACRILFFGSFFLFYLRTDFSAWGSVDHLFWMPTWFFRELSLPHLDSFSLSWLQWLWKLSMLTSAIGFATRISTSVAFILGFYLLGLGHNFGKTHHADTIVVIVLAVMAFSRCSDVLSLDRLLDKKRQGLRGEKAPELEVLPSGEYTWPIRAVWVTFGLIFFAAGVAKLRYAGLAWIFSDTVAILLVERHYAIANTPPLVNWALTIANYPMLCRSIAAVTLASELLYPLAVFNRRARAVLVPLMFLIQVAIRVLFGPSFNEFLICNLFWIPWGRVLAQWNFGFSTTDARSNPASFSEAKE